MNIHRITIDPVLNGFSVRVGCQTLVFTSVEHFIKELENYLRHPCEVEKSYRENTLNKWLLVQPGPCATAEPTHAQHEAATDCIPQIQTQILTRP